MVVTDRLTHDLISGPGFFVKQAPVFIQCTADLICELGSQIPGLNFVLLHFIVVNIDRVCNFVNIRQWATLLFWSIVLSKKVLRNGNVKYMLIVNYCKFYLHVCGC